MDNYNKSKRLLKDISTSLDKNNRRKKALRLIKKIKSPFIKMFKDGTIDFGHKFSSKKEGKRQ